jgi:hypothetical protein
MIHGQVKEKGDRFRDRWFCFDILPRVSGRFIKKEEAMKKKTGLDAERLSRKRFDRRTFLKMAAATAGPLIIQGVPSGRLFAADAPIALDDPKYAALYSNFEGRYMKDPKWVEYTLSRLRWPKAGERIPELTAGVQKERPFLLESKRKVATDAQELGIKYNL